MKTPEQIAEEQMQAFTVLHGFDSAGGSAEVEEVSAAYIKDQLTAAIEADRAQRDEVHPDWRDDQENVRDADHVSVSWTAHDARGRNTYQSDILITAEQAVGMFQGIGEAS